MEGLHCLKYLLEKNNFFCKIDLKYAYFSVPLCMSSRKFVRFTWSRNLYEFLCLCFELGPAPRIFSKLLKAPIALVRRLNNCLLIYLDDIILMETILEEVLMNRDTFIFLLQHLGFVINLKKISFETITTNRVFRSKNRYPCHDFGTNRGKYTKDNFEMPESPSSPSNHCFGINKIDRSDVLNCSSSSAWSSTAKVFTTTTNTIPKPSLFIPCSDSIKQSVKTGTSLVGGKFIIKQWKITMAIGTKFSGTNRCIKIRWWSLSQRGAN